MILAIHCLEKIQWGKSLLFQLLICMPFFMVSMTCILYLVQFFHCTEIAMQFCTRKHTFIKDDFVKYKTTMERNCGKDQV